MPEPRVALVTGGIQGLGAAAAKSLHALGCRVAVTNIAETDESVQFTRQSSLPHFIWDVSDLAACKDGIAEVEAQLGPVDILVNNAGVTQDAMFHKMAPDQWRSVLHVDLDSMFNMCRQVIVGMRERAFGRIINISSVNGLKGQIGQTNYCAAKAGILGFTKALALENARKGITVNAIAPGYCDTSMVAAMPQDVLAQITAQIPVGRLGQPEDIGRAVAFLASDDAGFITGSTLSVNGGMLLS